MKASSLAERATPAREQPVRLGRDASPRRPANVTPSELMRVVADEIAKRERDITESDGLLSVTIIIRMNERTGKPHRCLFRTESESDVRP